MNGKCLKAERGGTSDKEIALPLRETGFSVIDNWSIVKMKSLFTINKRSISGFHSMNFKNLAQRVEVYSPGVLLQTTVPLKFARIRYLKIFPKANKGALYTVAYSISFMIIGKVYF